MQCTEVIDVFEKTFSGYPDTRGKDSSSQASFREPTLVLVTVGQVRTCGGCSGKCDRLSHFIRWDRNDTRLGALVQAKYRALQCFWLRLFSILRRGSCCRQSPDLSRRTGLPTCSRCWQRWYCVRTLSL